MSEETIELLSFADLQGWEADDHAAALATFFFFLDDLNRSN